MPFPIHHLYFNSLVCWGRPASWTPSKASVPPGFLLMLIGDQQVGEKNFYFARSLLFRLSVYVTSVRGPIFCQATCQHWWSCKIVLFPRNKKITLYLIWSKMIMIQNDDTKVDKTYLQGCNISDILFFNLRILFSQFFLTSSSFLHLANLYYEVQANERRGKIEEVY